MGEKKTVRWDKEIVAELKAYTQMLTMSVEIPKPTRRFVGEVLEAARRCQA